MSKVIRSSETVSANISQKIEHSTLIGFDCHAAGMIFIPVGFKHSTLTFHAADAKGGDFFPIPGATLEVEEETAVPIPVECIGARHLKITGDAETDFEVNITRKS